MIMQYFLLQRYGRLLSQGAPTEELSASEAISRIVSVHERKYANPMYAFYRMLGLPGWHAGYTQEVRHAYLKVVLKVHPDKCDDARAELASQLLNAAHDDVEI